DVPIYRAGVDPELGRDTLKTHNENENSNHNYNNLASHEVTAFGNNPRAHSASQNDSDISMPDIGGGSQQPSYMESVNE
ncbi:6750_t:CDS:2, partial [Racocetra fulgida]